MLELCATSKSEGDFSLSFFPTLSPLCIDGRIRYAQTHVLLPRRQRRCFLHIANVSFWITDLPEIFILDHILFARFTFII